MISALFISGRKGLTYDAEASCGTSIIFHRIIEETPGMLPFTILPRESEEHWKEVIEKSSMNMFSEKDRYLWRVVFLEGTGSSNGLHEMIVTFHHAISDGISVESFFGQFLEYCTSVFNDTTPEIDTLPYGERHDEECLSIRHWCDEYRAGKF